MAKTRNRNTRARSDPRAPTPQDEGSVDATPSAVVPRRSGRQTSNPTDNKSQRSGQIEKRPPDSDGKRGRERASPNIAGKQATSEDKGKKRTPFVSKESGTNGSTAPRLRKRKSISLRETSDEDNDDDDDDASSSDDSYNDDSFYEDIASDIEEVNGETIYKIPEESKLPSETIIQMDVDGAISNQLSIPTAAIGDLLSAYSTLRAFSWFLRLSPFSFEDFCAAIASHTPTSLVDETHVSVLRALAVDETKEERRDRKLDLGLLDHLTWPQYVWEWLRLTEDPLDKFEWDHRLLSREHLTAQLDGQMPFNAGGNEKGNDATMRDIEEKQEEKQVEKSSDALPSPVVPSRPRTAFEPVDESRMDKELLEQPNYDMNVTSFFSGRGPAGYHPQVEYCSLPITAKAKILATLCDHLMDTTTIRAEIDRRELGNTKYTTGPGGEGDYFCILAPEEKARLHEEAKKSLKSDANTEICVLCSIGGNLLCCDGCRAAYHMRCLGETGKTLGDGDWMCPECACGGRGEAAGALIPVFGHTKWRNPVYLLNGSVILTELPAMQGRGSHAFEVSSDAKMTVLKGPEAIRTVEATKRFIGKQTRSRDTQFEVAYDNAQDQVRSPPQFPMLESGALRGPESYLNKYKNGWSAHAIALRSVVDESKKQKKAKGSNKYVIPHGTLGVITVPELPEPITWSKHQWIQIQGRPAGRATIRCGSCHTCLRPTLRKGCLDPITKAATPDVSAPIQQATIAAQDFVKLGYMIAYVLKVERDFWALAEGPWAKEPGGGMQFRARWATALRISSTAREVAQALLEFESVLRPIAFNSSWYGDSPNVATAAGGAAISSYPGSRLGSRTPSMGDLAHSGDGAPVDANGPHLNNQRESDPYDIRFEKLVKSGWEMNRRSHAAHVANINRLPRALLRKAARHSGKHPIPGVMYRKKDWTFDCPRQKWIAAMEAVQTCPQLALAIRQIDGYFNWDDILKPRGTSSENVPYSTAQVLRRRVAEDGCAGYEYLIQFRTPPAEAVQQHQMQAALLQQRIAMSQAQALIQQQQQMMGMGSTPVSAPTTAATGMPVPGRLGSLSHWPVPMPSQGVSLPSQAIPASTQFPRVFPSHPSAEQRLVSVAPPSVQVVIQQSSNINNEKLEQKQQQVEEENWGRKIVQRAIKMALEKEEEEKLLFMPAAMAAKMRSKQANSNQEVKSTLNHDDKAKKESIMPPPPLPPSVSSQIPASLMPFLAAQAGLNFPMFQPHLHLAPPPPKWIHEKDIPLWFVKIYEEMCRRESANAAARELQAAARRGSIADDAVVKAAAREAAHAAAQAAADACGICGSAQGDNAELDVLWICCDSCNRWFHGACVSMTHEDVDAIAEDEQWDCPGCSNARRKAERSARREGKTLSSTFSPADLDGVRGTGRSKPFYERADYKAGEARMLEKLRKGEVVKKRKSEALEQAEADMAAKALEREEQRKRRKEEARVAAEPPPPIHCPVCQYPDYGRPLLECSACSRWFHFECLGTAMEEINAAVSQEDKPVKCAECQGKRVRPPTQAAIDAAILAASETGKPAGLAANMARLPVMTTSAPPSKKPYITDIDLSNRPINMAMANIAASGPPKIHTETKWRDKVSRILTKTMRTNSAGPFCIPVSLEDAPDYLDIVKQPMDLGTLKDNLIHIPSPIEVLAAINLIVENCILYNGDESDYVQAAIEMQETFLKLWTAQGLPMTREQWQNMLAAGVSKPSHAKQQQEQQQEQDSNPSISVPPPSQKTSAPSKGNTTNNNTNTKQPKFSYSTSLAALAPLPNSKIAPDWKKRIGRVLQHVMDMEEAEPFLEPVPLDFLNYHQIIKKPMDLGTIVLKLSTNKYLEPAEVAKDVARTWTNCRIFNDPDADIFFDSFTLEKAFVERWVKEGVYQGRGGGRGGTAGQVGVAPLQNKGPSTTASRRPTTPTSAEGNVGGIKEWNDVAIQILDRLMNLKTTSNIFTSPVSLEDAPDYLDVVKQPMDLGTAMMKLRTGTYTSPNEFFADVQRIWSNAELYNGADHPITRLAQQTKRSFMDLCAQSGLDMTSSVAPLQRKQRYPSSYGPSASTIATATPTAEPSRDWMTAVRSLVVSTMSHPSSIPFNTPMNDEKAPGYSELITQPMAFGTVLKNLGRGKYRDAVAALDDMRQIFENCRSYYGNNPPGVDRSLAEERLKMGEEVEDAMLGAWQRAGLPYRFT